MTPEDPIPLNRLERGRDLTDHECATFLADRRGKHTDPLAQRDGIVIGRDWLARDRRGCRPLDSRGVSSTHRPSCVHPVDVGGRERRR